jgi:hypothetical protein
VHHWKRKNYADRLAVQEQIAEMRRRAAERADFALKGMLSPVKYFQGVEREG